MQVLPVQGRWGSYCCGLSTPYLEPLLPKGALRARREWVTNMKLLQAGNGGKKMRLFFQKRGRLEVGFWGEEKPGWGGGRKDCSLGVGLDPACGHCRAELIIRELWE